MHWFTKSWWEYLLAKKDEDESWWTVINCRRRGHPYGVIWYSSYGTEPDMTCKNCGDDLS